MVAGGLSHPLTRGVGGGNNSAAYQSAALVYSIPDETWSEMETPVPFVPARTQGCCCNNTMFIVSGGDYHCTKGDVGCRPIGGNVTRLTRTRGGWEWSIMPALPADGARHVGVAGIVDNEWLLLVGGAQIDPGQDPSSSQQQRHAVPDYRLPLRLAGDPPVLTAAGEWLRMAPHPLANATAGLTLPVGGALGRSWFHFGGQTADTKRTKAYHELDRVCKGSSNCTFWPMLQTDQGLKMTRKAFRYDVDSDTWTAIASLPRPLQGGGQQSVPLDDRHLLLMGSSHIESFRVGHSAFPSQAKAPSLMSSPENTAKYYGDEVLAYDRVTDTYSRVGKLLYGVCTGSWVSNGSHLLGFGGEPMHGWNSNSETVVQVAEVGRCGGASAEGCCEPWPWA